MKSYRQFCSVARALDVIGDRWALLVVRELLLGPRRYSDLLHGLPGVGTNVLATRLRELEETGIVARRHMPAPTPATVYELTDDGEDLRGVLDALGQWGGRRLNHPAKNDTVEPRWFVGSLAATVDASRFDDGATFALRVDDEPFTLSVDAGRLTAGYGEPSHAVATLVGTFRDFFAAGKGDRAAARRIKIEGDRNAARMLVGDIIGTNA